MVNALCAILVFRFCDEFEGNIDPLRECMRRMAECLQVSLLFFFFFFSFFLFRCVLASLYVGLSVRPSVRPSVSIKEKPPGDASYCPPGLVLLISNLHLLFHLPIRASFLRKFHLDGVLESLEEEAAAAEAAAAEGVVDFGRDSTLNAAVRDIPWDLEESTIFGLIDAFEQR